MNPFYVAIDMLCHECGGDTMRVNAEVLRFQCKRCQSWGRPLRRAEVREMVEHVSSYVRDARQFLRNHK